MHGLIRYARQHHVALIALFLALGGTSYAAVALPANSVGAKQIKKDAVTSKKVKNGSLKRQDFAAGQLPAGPTGPAGPVGPAGPPGPKGESFEPAVLEASAMGSDDSTSPKSTTVTCPVGMLAFGGYKITSDTDDAVITVVVNREEFPGGISQWVVTARETVAYAGNWRIDVFVNCVELL